MHKYIKITSAFAFVLVCTLVLAACGGTSQEKAFTANADIPQSVYARSTSTVSVSLATAGGYWQGIHASVQLVDVGAVKPLIDCGPGQAISPGNSGDFSCQIPPLNLGTSNEHKLQVLVNGKPNPPSPVPVYVENGGRVHAELVDASGVEISQVEPGDTFYVSFATRPTAFVTGPTAESAPEGRYSVSVPSGWFAGGTNGACTLTMTDPACKVAVTVPYGAPPGTYGLDLDKATGSSIFSPYLLAVGVKAATLGSAGAVTGSSGHLTFYVAQNISDTLYAGSQFNYLPVVLFKNTSTQPLDLSSATVTVNSGLKTTGLKSGCVTKLTKNASYIFANCTTLAPFDQTTGGPLFAVSGEIPQHTSPLQATVKFTISGSSGTLATYTKDVSFVPYVAKHVAVSVKAPTTGSAFYAVASMEKWNGGSPPPNYLIKFSKQNGYYVGDISTTVAATAFNKYQIPLSQTQSTLFYIPYGQSGVMYLNRGKIRSSQTPTHTGSLNPPRWLRLEMSYGSATQANAEILYFDQSYVNALGVMAAFNVMGKASPLSLYTQDTSHGILSQYLKLDNSQQVLRAIAKEFGDQHDSKVWKYDCSRQAGVQNYVRASFSGSGTNCKVNKYTEILAPITIANVILSANGKSYYMDPMRKAGSASGSTYGGPNDYYTSYIGSLWNYFKNNPMYVDTVLAQSASSGIGISTCIVKGTVTTSGDLVFTRYSGTCPTSKGPSGSNTVTTADPLVFAKFLPCDFLQAAGSATCNTQGSGKSLRQTGLYGVSDSYRAAVGEAIAAYQAAGLLPVCPGLVPPGLNLKKVNGTIEMTKDNARAITEHGGGFTNPTCLTSKAAPLWNVYAAILGKYDNVYSYSYGDYLGASGTVNFNPPATPAAWFTNLGKVAQPVTVKIIK